MAFVIERKPISLLCLYPPSTQIRHGWKWNQQVNEIPISNAPNILENRSLAHFNRPTDSVDISFLASSDYYNYCQPLLIIPEYQGRKSLSPSTAYPSRPKVSDSHVKESMNSETSKRHPKFVFMAKIYATSYKLASVSANSGGFVITPKLRMTK